MTEPTTWLCLLPMTIIVLWLSVRSIVRWKSRQYLIREQPATFGTRLYSLLFNPIRRSMGIRPLRVIPRLSEEDRPSIAMLERTDRLLRGVRASLRRSPINAARRASIERQAREVPDNLVKGLWTLARLRHTQDSIDPRFDPGDQNRQEIEVIRQRLLAEMTRSVETLSNIPVSLIKIEMARSDGSVDKVLSELDDSNKRLIDLSASYAEVRAI
jgi:hypothetical protein